jgi:hypothetical protein
MRTTFQNQPAESERLSYSQGLEEEEAQTRRLVPAERRSSVDNPVVAVIVALSIAAGLTLASIVWWIQFFPKLCQTFNGLYCGLAGWILSNFLIGFLVGKTIKALCPQTGARSLTWLWAILIPACMIWRPPVSGLPELAATLVSFGLVACCLPIPLMSLWEVKRR